MRRVILESPYAGDVDRNLDYARVCMKDALERGEAPFASHLLYTQVWDDGDHDLRNRGIAAGLDWGHGAHATVVYFDLGISSGMRIGVSNARANGRPVEFRSIFGAPVPCDIEDQVRP